MRAERIVAIALLLVGGGLGAFALSTAADRHAAQSAADHARFEAEAARARWSSEQHALEKRVLRFAMAKPLLAAVEQGVDRATLVALLESEAWWREVRSEFSVSRVIVGTEMLATIGAPELGARDRDVVVAARAERLASAVVTLGGHPYCRVAGGWAA